MASECCVFEPVLRSIGEEKITCSVLSMYGSSLGDGDGLCMVGFDDLGLDVDR